MIKLKTAQPFVLSIVHIKWAKQLARTFSKAKPYKLSNTLPWKAEWVIKVYAPGSKDGHVSEVRFMEAEHAQVFCDYIQECYNKEKILNDIPT